MGTHYHDYLELDTVLHAQHPKTTAHDEMLFIIVHQCYELWFKQIHHEIDSVVDVFNQKKVMSSELPKVLGRIQRIIKIKELFMQQLTILETMDPVSFLEFRGALEGASGFQSFQFRQLEVKLGISLENNPMGMPEFYFSALKNNEVQILKNSGPGLFKLVENWLERTPFLQVKEFNFWVQYKLALQEYLANDPEHLEHFECLFDDIKYEELSKKQKRRLSRKATLAALFITLYNNHPLLHLPYKILCSLVDMDEHLTTWRFRHALMAHRMIGSKMGTGGSSGHVYLTNASIGRRAFVDYFDIATFLIPQDKLKQLPTSLSQQLDFCYSESYE